MNWGPGLAALGYTKSATPVKGAIVIMQPSFPHAVGDLGHVAFASDVTNLGNGQWKLNATGANQECWIYGGCYSSAGCDNVNDWSITDSMNPNQIAFWVKQAQPPATAVQHTNPPTTKANPSTTKAPTVVPTHVTATQPPPPTDPEHTRRSDRPDRHTTTPPPTERTRRHDLTSPPTERTRRPDRPDRRTTTPPPTQRSRRPDRTPRPDRIRAEADGTTSGSSRSAWLVPIIIVVCVLAVAAVAVLVTVIIYKRRRDPTAVTAQYQHM